MPNMLTEARLTILMLFPVWIGLAGCASVRQEDHLLEFTGVLQQVTDLSDPITCYCDQAGYLDACGLLIPVCFESLGSMDPCLNVTVKGYFDYLDPDRRVNSVCPEGEQRLLILTEVICRD